MNNLDRSSFEPCALASGLLTQQQLDEARASVRWSAGDRPDPAVAPSDRQLADRLVEMQVLNAWQAQQLLEGRAKFNLGPYLILDSIGQGGMGQVFAARHEKIGRIVAIKVLPRDKSTPEAVANFTHEIRAVARLDHPRLVAAFDAGQDGNVHYLVTEYVPGLDLRKLVRRDGPLEMSAAARIVCQVAEGLEYAHEQGIVHRDVKPGNVLVSPDGTAKLSDLGLAGPLAGQSATDPRHGKIVGTADYISPDQVRDPWSPAPAWDIYSLGCTLYYAVTGKVPFPGGTTADKARAHCELRPLDPRRLNPSLSVEFVEAMADMMAKEPRQRMASAREVIERLTPFLPGRVESALPAQCATACLQAVHGASWQGDTACKQAVAHNGPKYGAAPAAASQRVLSPSSDEDSSSSKEIETFEPAIGADEYESASLEVEIPEQTDPLDLLWSLTVFLLAPLALVGAVLLLGLLVRTAL